MPPGPDGKRGPSVYSKDRGTAAEKLRKLQEEVDAGLVTTGSGDHGGRVAGLLAQPGAPRQYPTGHPQDYSRVIRNHIVPRIGSRKLQVAEA